MTASTPFEHVVGRPEIGGKEVDSKLFCGFSADGLSRVYGLEDLRAGGSDITRGSSHFGYPFSPEPLIA